MSPLDLTYLFSYLVAFAVFILQWAGVVFLGKKCRDRVWLMMIVGISLVTASFGLRFFAHGPVQMAADSLGSLLFFIGFAIHAMKGASLESRIAELEAIANSQMEELNTLRGTRG